LRFMRAAKCWLREVLTAQFAFGILVYRAKAHIWERTASKENVMRKPGEQRKS
jgi:hypothetical protein